MSLRSAVPEPDPERPVGVVAFAGGEGAAPDLVDALAHPVHPLAADAVVGRRERGAVVDDAGARPEVVVDPLPDQAVLPVVEDHLALRDRLAGVAVELDAIGEEPGGAADDLHVAGRDEQVGRAAHLLELVGDDAHLAALLRDAHGLGAGG